MKCESRDSAETLMTYASSGKDECVSVELQDLTTSEILAKEYMYHKSCYRNISREKKFPSREEAEECKKLFEKLCRIKRNQPRSIHEVNLCS